MQKILKSVLEWLICIIIALGIALILRYSVVATVLVKKSSMYPTLKSEQRLIVNKLVKIGTYHPKRGDIITLEAPTEIFVSKEELDLKNPTAIYDKKQRNIWESFLYYVLEVNKASYIKRVIGLPGEHLTIKQGKVFINGEVLEEDYLVSGLVTDANGGGFIDVQIPEGYLFVMGDNRTGSTDSRAFGCIPIQKVESKVMFRIWPFDKLGKVE